MNDDQIQRCRGIANNVKTLGGTSVELALLFLIEYLDSQLAAAQAKAYDGEKHYQALRECQADYNRVADERDELREQLAAANKRAEEAEASETSRIVNLARSWYEAIWTDPTENTHPITLGAVVKIRMDALMDALRDDMIIKSEARAEREDGKNG